MPATTDNQFARRTSRRKNLLVLAGLLAVVLLANGVVSLFALQYSNENHLADLRTLRQITAALETARSAQVDFKKQVQEWKDMLLRGSNPQDFAKYHAAFENEEQQVREKLTSLAALTKELQLSIPEIEQVSKAHETLGVEYRKALADYRNDDASARAADRKVRGIDRAPTDEMDTIVDRIHSRADELSKQIAGQTVARYRTLRMVCIGGTAAGVVLVLIFLALSFAAVPKE